jgi:hypothetical protein
VSLWPSCRFGALRQGPHPLVSPALPSREDLAPCYSIRRAITTDYVTKDNVLIGLSETVFSIRRAYWITCLLDYVLITMDYVLIKDYETKGPDKGYLRGCFILRFIGHTGYN